MNEHEKSKFILKASCTSDIGIVAAITEFLYQRGCYIEEMSEFDDRNSGNFFLRIVFSVTQGEPLTLEEFSETFAVVAGRFSLDWELHGAAAKQKVLILVSRYDHCINDLLYRWRTEHLPIEIVAVVSNHPDLEQLVSLHGIPYHHLPVTPEKKPQQEAQIIDLVRNTGADLVVLARYMQVLSDNLCEKLRGRAINIHHSLLPGFKGAKPYHRAYERGVKMVGATAHYVTADLDEGPIIKQGVQEVDHSCGPQDLIATGRDIESITLARAVKAHSEHRVFLNGGKAVVFR